MSEGCGQQIPGPDHGQPGEGFPLHHGQRAPISQGARKLLKQKGGAGLGQAPCSAPGEVGGPTLRLRRARVGRRAGAAQSWALRHPIHHARQGCRPQAAQRPRDYESRASRRHGPRGQMKQRLVIPPSRQHCGHCRGPRWAPSPDPPQTAGFP